MNFLRLNSLVLVFLSLLLTGCNSFLVSEDEVNREVSKQLEQNNQSNVLLTLEGGSALNLDVLVTAAKIDFTERDGGLVLVNLASDLEGTLTAFGQSFTLTTVMKPSFQSGVRIEEDRLYLVAPQIIKIEVQGTSFGDQMLRSTLGSLHDDLEKSLVEYFDIHPIYVLDHSPFEKAAASLVKSINIREESLELSVF